ncbi:YhgE/Pip domain-containing protein [Lacticaseibacillus absianus]|uniref:YhgE/Pip domain-containing protein n=1 Tax=Lacticaseibacillus absianus TaxID=2729623 RepID=UPI0015CCBDAF|nr:YhgE/Pip domain-containing protein [Lacticaseibacillus absianus]
MRNILALFALDWRRIFKSPFAFLLICALVVIPSLYCWFNVWALWDPYSNTQALKVAVYSADVPTEFRDQKVAIGDTLVAELKHNKKLGWRFVDSRQAVVDGVRSGKYYAGIVVPKRFSKDLLSFVDGQLQKPKLDYYVNEKVNAIAPKITGTGAATLQSTISTEFVDTVAKTLVGVFNQAGVKLDENLPMIRRFASLVTTTDAQLPVITGYLDQVSALQAKLPALQAKLQAANEMATYLPAVNAMAQKLVGANQYLPLVDDAGRLAVQVQGKLPVVQQAGQQLSGVVTHFAQLDVAVADALTVTSGGLTLIDQVDGTLPALTAFGQHAASAVDTTKDTVLPKVEAALTVVQNATDAGLTLIQAGNTSLQADLATLQDLLAQLTTADTPETRTAIGDRLTALATRQGQLADTATGLAATLQQLQASRTAMGQPASAALTQAIARLQHLATVATTVQIQARALAQSVPTMRVTDLQAKLTALSTAGQTVADAATALQQLDLSTGIRQVLVDFKALLQDAKTTLAALNDQLLPELPQLLATTKSVLRQANTFLKQAQTQLPALRQELEAANTLLNGHMQLITSGITTVAGLYQTEFPALQQKLTRATAFIQQDLPAVEAQLTETLGLANTKMPVLASGLADAQAFIDTDWPTLKDAIQRGAAAIRKGEQSIDLTQLIKLLKRDATKEANFLAAPVTLHETALYHIPTYGSQSAPFYLALCIWVGALLLGAILITEYSLPAALAGATVRQQYIARWLTFAGLGMLQALIAAVGNLVLIGTYVVNKPLYLLFAMLLSLVFVSILYALIALFGNIGKGLGIIILVLSISGAGGNFPVVLSGQFFQAINPWLPFTYAVNLLRETVGGIYWPNLWVDIWALLAFGAGAFLLGLMLKAPIRPWIDKMHAVTRKSKIIE